MKKSNPIDAVFKDKAKFDTQIPVIGTLLAQANNEDKKRGKAFLNRLSGAPSITDLNIRKRLQGLKDFNEGRVNDNDDDNNDGGIDTLSPPNPPQIHRRDIFPSLLYTPSGDDDNDLNAAQCFLLQRPQTKRVAEAICQELTRTTPQRVTFSEKLTRVFPSSRKIMENFETIEEEPTSTSQDLENLTVSDAQAMAEEVNQGELPKDLKFFAVGEKEGATLILHARKNFGILSKDSEKILDYLTTTFGRELLIRNKMKIHIESGQTFHGNQITGESFYDFSRVQEDVTKVNVDINDNFEYYVREVLAGITNDRYDMNSNSTSKFLFYHFNTLR